MPPVVIRRWPIPTRNDVQLQFSSIDLTIGDGANYFPWVVEISYDLTLTPGEARGLSPFPMGVTTGESTSTASLSIHRTKRAEFMDFVQAGGGGYMTTFFAVQVAYQEEGWQRVEMDTFDARVTGMGHEYQTGNSPLMVKIPLYTPLVRLNGQQPVTGVLV